MQKKKNILVFPCGSEIGLEINRALANDIHFEMFGASSLPDHGKFVYKNYIEGVPFVDNDNFIDEINKICEKYQIDYIFPAHDSVVLKCAQNVDKLKCKVLTSDVKVCEIARSKAKTYSYFKDIILCPKVYSIDNIDKYPVFLKPDVGQGSKGCSVANSYEEVAVAVRKDPSLLILEYLPGKEYTIDCFSDMNGKLCYVQGRQRARILNGISANSFPVSDVRFMELAEKINNAMHFKGVWFFQVKENENNELCLMEFAPRIAGTMEINRMQGVNLPLMWCFAASGYPIYIIKNDYSIEIDRALSNSFKIKIDYDTIYIDYDDCLVSENHVNHTIVAYLYKAFSNGKKLILLSKHKGDLISELKNFRLYHLFDEIIHIKPEDEKYKYIKDKKSIFIDDSFAERKSVHDKLELYVFAPDMIEGML